MISTAKASRNDDEQDPNRRAQMPPEEDAMAIGDDDEGAEIRLP